MTDQQTRPLVSPMPLLGEYAPGYVPATPPASRVPHAPEPIKAAVAEAAKRAAGVAEAAEVKKRADAALVAAEQKDSEAGRAATLAGKLHPGRTHTRKAREVVEDTAGALADATQVAQESVAALRSVYADIKLRGEYEANIAGAHAKLNKRVCDVIASAVEALTAIASEQSDLLDEERYLDRPARWNDSQGSWSTLTPAIAQLNAIAAELGAD